MNVVLDTNVWVSAPLSRGSAPARVVDMAASGSFRIVTTEHLWSEFARVIHEPKTRKVLQAHGMLGSVEVLLATRPGVQCVAERVPTQRWLLSDPDDDWVIQCALTATAEYIVTGDKQLLALAHVETVRIVSPSVFLTEALTRD